MNDKDNFQIFREERTKLVNRVADLETENNRMRMQLRKVIQLHQAVRSVVEDVAFSQLAPETQLKLKETKFARFIRQGLIPKSIQKKGNHPFWTIRQMRLAAKQMAA